MALTRTVADGCERLRTVTNGCEHKRNVERTHPQPPDPQNKREPLLRIQKSNSSRIHADGFNLAVFTPKCLVVNRSSKESTTPMLRCKKISPGFEFFFTRHKIHLLIATTCLGEGLFDHAGPQRSIRSTRSRPSRTVTVGRHDIINDHGPPGAASRGLDGVPVVKD